MYKSEARYEAPIDEGRLNSPMIHEFNFGKTADEAWNLAKTRVRKDYQRTWLYRVPEIVGSYVITDGCSIIGYINVWEE